MMQTEDVAAMAVGCVGGGWLVGREQQWGCWSADNTARRRVDMIAVSGRKRPRCRLVQGAMCMYRALVGL